MKNLKLAWLLLRLVRRIEKDAKDGTPGASFTLVVESGEGFEQRQIGRVAKGLEPEKPRRGCEVCYWGNVGEQGHVRRGVTMEAALELALGGS